MYFIPFIVLATFTILSLFIGIIVSTMQELSQLPDPTRRDRDVLAMLQQLDENLRALREHVLHSKESDRTPPA